MLLKVYPRQAANLESGAEGPQALQHPVGESHTVEISATAPGFAHRHVPVPSRPGNTDGIAPATSDNKTESQATQAGEQGEHTRGVIRLLQEGHFKGVADVRLRINFQSEIQALTETAQTRARDESAVALAPDVTTKVGEFLATGELPEEQATAVQAALDTFNAAVAPAGTPASADTIVSAFDAFITAALNVFTLNDAKVAEGESPDPAAFFSQLAESFHTRLEEPVSDIDPLPALSEPGGNGRAYDKFLAIYNDLVGNNTDAATAPLLVDTEA